MIIIPRMKRVCFQKLYLLLMLIFFGCSHFNPLPELKTVSQEQTIADPAESKNRYTGKILPDGRVQRPVPAPTTVPKTVFGESLTTEVPDIDDEVSETDGKALSPIYLEIPDQAHIKRCQKYYLRKYRRDYTSALDRRRMYGAMIRRKVRERRLPDALVWIPMVETWFKNNAYSRSHAAGLWQLIPATARTFGLRIDDWVDERFDPEKATDTALDILEYLHDRTGDWLLAIAAYNTGEGRVNRAIRRVGSRDYWTLARHRALPSQTRFYVPAVLALAEIDRDPDIHDITIPVCGDICKKTVMIDKQVSLWQIAAECQIDPGELRALNPSLKRAWTPPDTNGFQLYVPTTKYRDVWRYVNESKEKRPRHLVVHVIQPGDTLSDLARQYKSTVDAIMAANQLTKHLIIAGRELLIPAGLTWN